VNPNTVARYSRIAGEHARNAHGELVALGISGVSRAINTAFVER
jgi:hypothetical protein